MWKARKLIYCLNEYLTKNWQISEVSQSWLIDYLSNSKNFIEDIRQIPKRFIHSLTGKWFFQNGAGINRIKKQSQEIKDVIELCKKRDYLDVRLAVPHSTSSEIYLSVNSDGRALIKRYPFPSLFFIEECFDKNKTTGKIIISLIIGGGLFALLSKIQWSNLTDFLKEIF